MILIFFLFFVCLTEVMTDDSGYCLEVRCYRSSLLVTDPQSQPECFCSLTPPSELEYLPLELLIKLAYPTTKYQCTPLRVGDSAVHKTATEMAKAKNGGREGQDPPVRLLASAEEAVSLTVSRGSFLTF